MLDKSTFSLLANALNQLEAGFSHLPDFEPKVDLDAWQEILNEVATRMHDNYPYFHPYYAGQMLKPPHPVARLAYMLAMWINPNNHALDGGKASSAMEKEVISKLAAIWGWEQHLGHLCGGGTIANMEALWINSQVGDAQLVVASELAHYTHKRISAVLQLPFKSVPCNTSGVMDVNALKQILEQNEVGTVVATMGTTGNGVVDPLPEILELRDHYSFRVHADAAYGGYFTLVNNLSLQTRLKYDMLGKVDSIVIDPHKHGLQPYGCGCVLFRDPGVGAYYQHDSPYTYFTSDELHLGEISLECSRAGAAAVGLWATHRYMPPVQGGQFANDLSACRAAALGLYERIAAEPALITLIAPELDIVIWGVQASSLTHMSQLAQQFFDLAARNGLHLALIQYPTHLLPATWEHVEKDAQTVTCLRSVLMKPEHKFWLDQIWHEMQQVLNGLKGEDKTSEEKP